jgi:hypothetical protein
MIVAVVAVLMLVGVTVWTVLDRPLRRPGEREKYDRWCTRLLIASECALAVGVLAGPPGKTTTMSYCQATTSSVIEVETDQLMCR